MSTGVPLAAEVAAPIALETVETTESVKAVEVLEAVEAPEQEARLVGTRIAPQSSEAAFLQDQLHVERGPLVWVIFVLAVACAAFVGKDWMHFGATAQFWKLLAVRVSYVLISAGVTAFILRSDNRSSRRAVLIAWAVSFVFFLTYVNSTRPRDFFGHVPVDVLVVLSSYLIPSMTVRMHALTGLLTTAGSVVTMLWFRDPPAATVAASVYLSLGVANALGLMESIRVNRALRHRYLGETSQSTLAAELQAALGELRTLRGIVPICMHCKKICDDEGAWHEVERYVQAHTHATFSHGICKPCSAEHYPEAS